VIQKFSLVFIAGGIGALARYGLSGAVQQTWGGLFPWGTAVVNIAGCLVAGFLWELAGERLGFSSDARTVVFIGFFGSFTTFSTLMLETVNLLRDGQWLWAAGNLSIQNAAGFAALVAGTAAARWLSM
jgi:CrcB protein